MSERPIFYVASVLIVAKGYNCPNYYVTTNAGVSCFIGFDDLPKMVKKWLDAHNDARYVIDILSNDKCFVVLVSDMVV